MASAIGPGDWIECINSDRADSHRLGRIFQCERVWEAAQCGRRHGACGGVSLVGDPEPHPFGWALCCWRPVYRPRSSLIEALKAPVTRTPQVVKPIREDA